MKTKLWIAEHGIDQASVSGQWVGTGVPVTFTVWETEDGFYLTVDLEDEEYIREFCKENGYSEEYVDETKQWCQRFGGKHLGAYEEYVAKLATEIVADELNDGSGFEYDGYFIFGY